MERVAAVLILGEIHSIAACCSEGGHYYCHCRLLLKKQPGVERSDLLPNATCSCTSLERPSMKATERGDLFPKRESEERVEREATRPTPRLLLGELGGTNRERSLYPHY
ncbi:hypothetical protein O6H91_16G077300 [Diphasiastrum complanatum]|uniref:Uncharacterized protein n=1 Tax=Diphasiastrum complanatum TaxID=34168 RepID=A0ACC2BDW9_DIPCM|nr:hypothetical protein O6H91_16G077300 [Diphasiastrum complanatum]